MAFDKAALIEQLGNLTVLELVDLVEGLKETWGVEAAAAALAALVPAALEATGIAIERLDDDEVGVVPADAAEVRRDARAADGSELRPELRSVRLPG